MKIGYARVSTVDQNLDLQLNELTNYGCGTIYEEKVSEKNTEKLELKKHLSTVRKGDQARIGFSHEFKRLSEDEMRFIFPKIWENFKISF
jgi:predicted site-specific integrase-resolvase